MSGDSNSVSGACLCGAVKFEATPEKPEVGVCHCSMCRTWAAGPFMGIGCGSSLKVEDDEHLGVYKSSDWSERGYCKSCGTPLFWRTSDGRMAVVSVNAVNDPGELALTHEIFVDEQPAYYAFANKTHKMTGAEVFAMFASKEND